MHICALQIVKYIPAPLPFAVRSSAKALAEFILNHALRSEGDLVLYEKFIDSLPVQANEPFQAKQKKFSIYLNLCYLRNMSVFLSAPDAIGEPKNTVNSAWFEEIQGAALSLCEKSEVDLYCYGGENYGNIKNLYLWRKFHKVYGGNQSVSSQNKSCIATDMVALAERFEGIVPEFEDKEILLDSAVDMDKIDLSLKSQIGESDLQELLREHHVDERKWFRRKWFR